MTLISTTAHPLAQRRNFTVVRTCSRAMAMREISGLLPQQGSPQAHRALRLRILPTQTQWSRLRATSLSPTARVSRKDACRLLRPRAAHRILPTLRLTASAPPSGPVELVASLQASCTKTSATPSSTTAALQVERRVCPGPTCTRTPLQALLRAGIAPLLACVRQQPPSLTCRGSRRRLSVLLLLALGAGCTPAPPLLL